MRLRPGAVTRQQRTAALAMAHTGDLAYAARKAGYVKTTGVRQAMQRPDVQRIYHAERDRLISEAYPLAVTALIEVATQTKALMPRVMAAKAIAGLVDDAVAASGSSELELHQMTAEQLHLAATQGAKLIEALALPAPIEEEEPDIYG